MAVDTFEDAESFTEEWRLRHETLINEIRSLQSHVTIAPETVEPPQVEAEQDEPQPQIEAQIETKIEPVAEEMDGEGEEESMCDSAPSWKRQAKELDRLNARLQASLETSIPSIAMATKGRSKSSCPKRSCNQMAKALRRGAVARSCSPPRSQAASRPDGVAKMSSSNPNEAKGSDFKDKMEKMEKMDKMEKKGSDKMEKMDKKGSSTRHEAEPEVSRSSALATSKWPEPTRPVPKRAAVKKRTGPRTVSRRLQVGAPFDQPRMSVMARLSVMAQAEAKEVETTCAPTVTVKNWNIPRLCLEAAQTAQSFSGVVPSTTGSYVPSSTSSPQMWYRPVSSQVSQVSQLSQVPSGAFRHSAAQVLQKASPVSQRLAL